MKAKTKVKLVGWTAVSLDIVFIIILDGDYLTAFFSGQTFMAFFVFMMKYYNYKQQEETDFERI